MEVDDLLLYSVYKNQKVKGFDDTIYIELGQYHSTIKVVPSS